MTTARHPFKPGDIFYSSWGYDQTNVDFYKVVGVTPGGVRIQEWQSRAVQGDRASTRVVPGDGPRTYPKRVDGVVVGQVSAGVQFKRVQTGYAGGYRLAWQSFADLYPWDGSAKWETAIGAGH